MAKSFKVHFVYLAPEATGPEWKQIHCFLHPEALEQDQQPMLVCRDLDMSHHAFVSLRAKDWAESKGTWLLLLRYDLVASILEVRSHTNQLGFVDLKAIREALAEGSEE